MAPSPPLRFDALLVVGFGGPEHPDDVMPFLRNVTAGRNVPDERLAEVAEQYALFGGVSPINDQTEALARALASAMAAQGVEVPVYVGNRNWRPFLVDTVAAMAADGVTSPLAIATSAFSSYSGCRQYREDLAAALGATDSPYPAIPKVPPFWPEVGFLDAVTERIADTLEGLGTAQRSRCRLVFTAHSIPVVLAQTSEYEAQLRRAAATVAERIGLPHELVFQSRSGPPQVPWLEPDIVDHLRALDPGTTVAVVPLGFLSDHMEVLFDLDTQAADAAQARGITMLRVPTVGTSDTFVDGLAASLVARFHGEDPVTIDGEPGRPFPCAADCCPPPPPRPRPPAS